MKQMIIILMYLVSLSLFSGCDSSGGGVTSEPQPPGPVTPPPSAPAFSTITSQLLFQSSTNQDLQAGTVGQQAKVVLLAKDQFGNSMTGLNIKLGVLFDPDVTDLVASEVSAGRYEISFTAAYQSDYQAYVKLDDVDKGLSDLLNISYCNGTPNSSGGHPFHSQITILSKQYYVLCSTSHLFLISQSNTYLDSNFVLGKNLDFSSFYTDANMDQIPDNQFKIGSLAIPYTGEFIGGSFAIDGFKYKSTIDNVGLFTALGDSALIKSVTMVNADVSGNNNVGVLVGSVNLTSGTVTIDNATIGSAALVGNNKVGGIVGFVNNTAGTVTIKDSSSFLTFNLNGITNDKSQMGSIIGHNIGANVESCTGGLNLTYTDKLHTISKIGGLIGEEQSSNGSKISLSSVSSTQNYSSGTQIGCMIGYVNSSEIDLQVGSSCFINQNGASPADITTSGGFFGEVNNSSIKNISSFVDASNIVSVFGGLAGTIQNSTIENVNMSGTIVSTSSNIGGIAGNASNNSFDKVQSYVSIYNSAGINSIGGIIGNSQTNTLSRVANYGDILAPNASVVGGLVGLAVQGISISDGLNGASIYSDSYVGGLIGQLSDDVANNVSRTYNSGTIFANDHVGGLIGAADSSLLSISESFSIGLITTEFSLPPSNSGSIVGELVQSPASSNNFFLSESTQLLTTCGTGAGCAGITATDTNTVADLETDLAYYLDSGNDPLSNWDFVNVWDVFAIYFPYLR